VTAADHGEGERGVEEARTGQDGDGLLARVDEVRVHLVLGRVGAGAEDAVLGVQDAPWTYGPLLHVLVGGLLGAERHHPLDEDAGDMDGVRLRLARLHELFDLGDGDAAGHGGERVEVGGGLAEAEVAVAVAAPGPHEGVVGGDAVFQDVGGAV